jgi:hypothetical protein
MTIQFKKLAKASALIGVLLLVPIVYAVTIELIAFSPGWNMVSIPLYASVKGSPSSTCSLTPAFFYNPQTGEYEEAGTLDAVSLEPGKGYWIYMWRSRDPTNPCFNIQGFKGDSEFTEYRNQALYAGWNMVGGLSEPVRVNEVVGDCRITSGPWYWNTGSGKYEKTDVLDSKRAYWVKVESNCAFNGPLRTLN